ncbi:Na(+)-translocating NADH-quinone reductase subunit C [Flavobacteriaceae bacterium F08102]|nr:Na(+)-translocating NADH-quinone reductase subunit C [Flavobacteriaceae bacterium F08102]
MANKTDSNTYTVLFAIGMVLVVGSLLAFSASVFNPQISLNKKLEKQQNILFSMGINEATLTNDEADVNTFVPAKEVTGIFKKYIKEQLVIEGDKVTPDSLAYLIDLKKETEKAKDPNYQRKLPVFIGEKDNEKFYIIPVRGAGLWDAIWGYIALSEDLRTVKGAYFDHKGETPGLGANIKEPYFYNDFKGEELFDGDQFKGITVAKGNADPKNLDKSDHEVDAIAGATITGNGVTAMIKKDLAMYLPFFNSLKNRVN